MYIDFHIHTLYFMDHEFILHFISYVLYIFHILYTLFVLMFSILLVFDIAYDIKSICFTMH